MAVEGVIGALEHGPPGHLLTGERDQGLATALAAEVVQDENGVGLKLQQEAETNKTKSLLFMQSQHGNTRGRPHIWDGVTTGV